MRLTINPLEGDIFNLDVPNDTIISGLKLLISVECGTSEDQFSLMKANRIIVDPDLKIESAGFVDGDVIVLVPASQQQNNILTERRATTSSASSRLDFSSIRFPRRTPESNERTPASSIEFIRKYILSGPPEVRRTLGELSPALTSSLNDPDEFAQFYQSRRAQEARQRLDYEELMNADPLDPVVQSKIEEIIRQKNIDMHLETALEHYPETFAQVSMLFVNCKVGKHDIKAFVDSGAQSTIMSQNCALRCNLERYIDKRWAGMAYGVGTQTIIGRVHNGQLEIGGAFLPTSFVVLKDQQLDLMIGLDMLKRHQCCIDLKRNALLLDGGRVEAPFLPESEIPLQIRHAELMGNDGPPSEVQMSLLDRLTDAQREKVRHLMDQNVPLSRAITELESHGWDVHNALVSYMSSDDVQ